MKRSLFAGIVLCLSALCAVPALASAQAQTPAITFVQQPDSSCDLAGVEILLQAGLDRQTPRENGLAALVAETILQTPVPANGSAQTVSLQNAVNANGGSIVYVVEPRHVRFYVEGMPQNFAASLALFRRVLAAPDFSDATIRAARAALGRKIADNQQSALDVGIDMLNRAFYQDSDAGMPPYGMPETLSTFTPGQARAFYLAHYLRSDAVVSAVGDLSAVGGADFASLAGVLPAGSSAPPVVRLPQLPSTSRQLIARRNITVPWLVAQYPAPDLRSRDFGAMLILTAFMQRTLADVSEVPSIATQSAAARGVGAFYNFDTYPANVIMYVDGGLGDPTRTFATALTVVNVLGHAKIAGDLSEMKAFAVGRFLEDTQTMQDRAWIAGIFASQHVAAAYPDSILRAISATTAADLQRVAARYLGAPTIALVLPRAQGTVQSPTP